MYTYPYDYMLYCLSVDYTGFVWMENVVPTVINWFEKKVRTESKALALKGVGRAERGLKYYAQYAVNAIQQYNGQINTVCSGYHIL